MSSRLTTLLAPVAAILAACNGGQPSVPPTTVTLTDYAVAAPATIPAQMATFNVVNKGKEAHQAGLVRLDSGKTYADFQAGIKGEMNGPPPAWIVWVGGVNTTPGDSNTVTIPLEAGTYVWYCPIPSADGVPHMAKGMTAPLTVTASTTAAAAAPSADIDVTMKDYTWDFSTPVTAGKHTLKVTTAAGAQMHEMALVRLQPGKAGKDFVDWAMKMAGPPPIEWLGGIATLQPGQVNYMTADFKAGNYAVICFVPDAKDGQPHAMHGMVKEFTVQ